MPVGFTHITGTKETGFVIRNETDGNEFVWIHVDLIIDGYTIKDWNKGIPATDFTEFYVYNSSDNANIISEIDTSVRRYKGFYISRYEAGTETQRTYHGQALTTVASKPTSGETPIYAYNYVTWTRARELAGELYNKAEHNVQSRLINARGWDTALKFIEQVDSNYPTDSTDKGWYSNYSGENPNYETGNPLGASTNMIKNIYDMGGNVEEWTADQYTSNTDHRARRGGYRYDSGYYNPAAYRIHYTYDDSSSDVGFRIALYL